MEDKNKEESPKISNQIIGNPCRIDDQRILQFLDSTDDYLVLMDSLSHILRQGWFELAGARYSMGVSRVNGTRLDLKPHSAPTSLRIVTPGDDASKANYTLNKWESFSEGNFEQDKPSDGSELRRRGGASRVPERTTPQIGVQVEKERLKSLSVFGTFVSPKLRTAQHSFETALEKIVEIANVRSKMLALSHQLKDRFNEINDSYKF